MLRDSLALSEHMLLVPAPLAPLLGLMDGTRDAQALGRAFELRTGYALPAAQVHQVLHQLRDALFLEDTAYREARERALEAYRAAPARPPTLAGQIYAANPTELAQQLAAYGASLAGDPLPADGADPEPRHDLVGIVSPHIDYQRGGRTYAQVWSRAAAAARRAELVIILGTDHAGAPGLTLTRQPYATPWGVLPTDRAVVNDLADALGPPEAFAQELHHRGEHSIELAAVWLHYVRAGQPCPVVPILCGSFAPYVGAEQDPEQSAVFAAALEVLRPLLSQRRTLVVAAADLAHVGPAFGDPTPVDAPGRERLASVDRALLAAASSGDAAAFFRQVQEVGDRFRICGLPPIYLMLRLVGAAQGDVLGYDQCPADAEGGSLVSIAGVTVRRPS
ncbi:MAG: AmmeMemoRadiSam system protein B [Chloroflexi bacterium]|nr:AmmeMemoRadiSam system protein B [Chloroflexota bacterium]